MDAINSKVIDDVQNKISNIANTICALTDKGYIPNKSKYITLNWNSMLLHCYNNISILNEDQQNKLNNLFNLLSEI